METGAIRRGGSSPSLPAKYGRLAQLGEQVAYIHSVGSSNLSSTTIKRDRWLLPFVRVDYLTNRFIFFYINSIEQTSSIKMKLKKLNKPYKKLSE